MPIKNDRIEGTHPTAVPASVQKGVEAIDLALPQYIHNRYLVAALCQKQLQVIVIS